MLNERVIFSGREIKSLPPSEILSSEKFHQSDCWNNSLVHPNALYNSCPEARIDSHHYNCSISSSQNPSYVTDTNGVLKSNSNTRHPNHHNTNCVHSDNLRNIESETKIRITFSDGMSSNEVFL